MTTTMMMMMMMIFNTLILYSIIFKLFLDNVFDDVNFTVLTQNVVQHEL
jgi:hypothetical protein